MRLLDPPRQLNQCKRQNLRPVDNELWKGMIRVVPYFAELADFSQYRDESPVTKIGNAFQNSDDALMQ